MKILRYPLGTMQANCYFVIKDNGCLIVDPADDASFVLEELQRRRLKLVGMLATHGHFDHVMAAGEIQLSINVPLYICRNDQFLIDRLVETADYFLGYKPMIVPPKNIKYFEIENSLSIRQAQDPEFIEGKIENFKLKIIHTPGHTPGSACFYIKEENILFSGDTLFKQGIGRYDFSYSSEKDLQASLKKLKALPDGTTVYSGHGEETILEVEKDFTD